MNACWAATLGDCSEKLSREHLVSQALFTTEVVSVQGFPWCKDAPKEVGLASLTSKILCTYHNSALSPIDTVGAEAFSTLAEMRRVANVRQSLRPPFTVVKHKINGLGLERWFLKTLVNLACDGKLPIGRQSNVAGRPSEELVEIIYGHKSFDKRAGLYSIVHVGMKLNSSETVMFSPLIKNGSHIQGGLYTFRGFVFLLFLDPDGPPAALTGLSFAGEDLGQSQLNFHNQTVVDLVGKYRSQVLTFDWKSHI